uniref:Uncharacterized protein n=1 Tax=Anguilla anguilla TaxID=7936 RepID=A0A0E9XY74_ANGAN
MTLLQRMRNSWMEMRCFMQTLKSGRPLSPYLIFLGNMRHQTGMHRHRLSMGSALVAWT